MFILNVLMATTVQDYVGKVFTFQCQFLNHNLSLHNYK